MYAVLYTDMWTGRRCQEKFAHYAEAYEFARNRVRETGCAEVSLWQGYKQLPI